MPRLNAAQLLERRNRNVDRLQTLSQNVGLNLDGKSIYRDLYFAALINRGQPAHDHHHCDHSPHEDEFADHRHFEDVPMGDAEPEHDLLGQDSPDDDDVDDEDMDLEHEINDDLGENSLSETTSASEDEANAPNEHDGMDANEDEIYLIHEVMNFISDSSIPVSERVSDITLLSFMRRHGENMVF
jgi:hypothetical protein